MLSDFRKDFTGVSGLSHSEVGFSHDSSFSFLTGTPHPELRSGVRDSDSETARAFLIKSANSRDRCNRHSASAIEEISFKKFTSVREFKPRMIIAEQWSKRPKPQVDAKQPQNNMNSADLFGKTRLMFHLIYLAIQTDSTRLITMLLPGTSQVPPIQ